MLQLQAAANDTYSIEQCTDLAGFSVELSMEQSAMDMSACCFVTLTSTLLRQAAVTASAASVATGHVFYASVCDCLNL